MDVFIRPGDSIWYYSQVFKLPLQLIVDSNPNLNAQGLLPQQKIKIPGYVTNQYTIQHGDSIWEIAQRINMHMDAILLLNPTLNPNQLQIGQIIVLPIRVTWRVVNGKQDYDYHTMISDIEKLQMI